MLPGGGASPEEKEWAPDRGVTLGALAAIDHRQAHRSSCRLCGQRCNALDAYGLCSKTSETHRDWRAGVRNDTKVGVR